MKTAVVLLFLTFLHTKSSENNSVERLNLIKCLFDFSRDGSDDQDQSCNSTLKGMKKAKSGKNGRKGNLMGKEENNGMIFFQTAKRFE